MRKCNISVFGKLELIEFGELTSDKLKKSGFTGSIGSNKQRSRARRKVDADFGESLFAIGICVGEVGDIDVWGVDFSHGVGYIGELQ